jgi:hypothetical protein
VIRSTGSVHFITAAGHVISLRRSVYCCADCFFPVRPVSVLPCPPSIAFRSAPVKRHEDHSSFHEVFNLLSRGQNRDMQGFPNKSCMSRIPCFGPIDGQRSDFRLLHWRLGGQIHYMAKLPDQAWPCSSLALAPRPAKTCRDTFKPTTTSWPNFQGYLGSALATDSARQSDLPPLAKIALHDSGVLALR